MVTRRICTADAAEMNAWVMSHTTTIDLQAEAGAPSADLSHPASYRALAECIRVALAA